MEICEWESKQEIRQAMKLALSMGDTHRFDVLAGILLTFKD